MPGPADNRVAEIWRRILEDANHHVLVLDEGGALCASCVLVVVPNLPHGGRPYALIEYVVTDAGYRRRRVRMRQHRAFRMGLRGRLATAWTATALLPAGGSSRNQLGEFDGLKNLVII
jgi:hypothetical protein